MASGAASVSDAARQYRVQDIKPLNPRRPDGEAEALALLEKVAWQVQPIMKRRQWTVGLLIELEPENMSRGGDNLNRGERVRIKVRRPGGGHYSYEHVLKVMLHELCHNEFGPHSASFYKLLDELTVECDALIAKKQGGTGAGFDAEGTVLGYRDGFGALPPANPRAAAREAALARARYMQYTAGGGKLGGASKPADARAAAAAAAERRLANEAFTQRAGLEHDTQEAGEAPAERTAPREPPPPPPRLIFSRPPCVCGACGPCVKDRGDTADSAIELDDDDGPIIIPGDGRCFICDLPPARCACWSCKACTLRNGAVAARCGGCDAWRFARGPPPQP